MTIGTWLLCPPDHYDVLYSINPHMVPGVRVDPDRARDQWEGLRRALRDAGAWVVLQEPVAGLPDLVFTNNAGWVRDGRALLSRFVHPERQGETPHDAETLAGLGYAVEELPADAGAFEGAAEVVEFGGRLLCGFGQRSERSAHAALGRFAGLEVVPVRLVDPRLYHLDVSVLALDDRHALVAPSSMDPESLARVLAVVPEPILLEHDEAIAFAANSVVVGDAVLMACVPPRLGRELDRHGFVPVEVPAGEFLKAGGGPRCLSLRLDPPVSAAPVTAGTGTAASARGSG